MPRKDNGVPNSEWGTKRTCDKCAARFYDLNRAPAVCPQCGTHHVDKTSAKTAAAKVPLQDPEPKVNDEPVKASDADNDNGVDDEEQAEEEEDIDTESKDDELLEDASDLVEDADDMAEVMDNREDPAKE